MKNYLTSIFPDIQKLSSKDSSLSTKRYSDLRLLNHLILQSWVILGIFTWNKLWHEVTLHFVFLGILCFARGVLASKFIDNLFNGRRDNRITD